MHYTSNPNDYTPDEQRAMLELVADLQAGKSFTVEVEFDNHSCLTRAFWTPKESAAWANEMKDLANVRYVASMALRMNHRGRFVPA